jgi:kanamycin kinase
VRDLHPEHAYLTLTAALARLERLRPRSEDLVVCHGDYCLPNVLVADGRVSGFVDLGELGVADRWWDLAVGSWSITWNLGPGFQERFLRAYGVSRDEGRIAFFRLLYDLVS